MNTNAAPNYEAEIESLKAYATDLKYENKELLSKIEEYEAQQKKAKSSFKRCWVWLSFFLVISVAWFGGEILFYGCSQSSLIDTFIAAVIARHLTNIWMEAT